MTVTRASTPGGRPPAGAWPRRPGRRGADVTSAERAPASASRRTARAPPRPASPSRRASSESSSELRERRGRRRRVARRVQQRRSDASTISAGARGVGDDHRPARRQRLETTRPNGSRGAQCSRQAGPRERPPRGSAHAPGELDRSRQVGPRRARAQARRSSSRLGGPAARRPAAAADPGSAPARQRARLERQVWPLPADQRAQHEHLRRDGRLGGRRNRCTSTPGGDRRAAARRAAPEDRGRAPPPATEPRRRRPAPRRRASRVRSAARGEIVVRRSPPARARGAARHAIAERIPQATISEAPARASQAPHLQTVLGQRSQRPHARRAPPRSTRPRAGKGEHRQSRRPAHAARARPAGRR